MDTMTITLDGKCVTAEKGRTVLDIARTNGIDIPTLCHNSKISTTTSCFVCLVKDAKSGKFLPSCSFVPSEGMAFDVETDEVRDMRKTALNLLLSEHTGDCEAPCTLACPAHAKVEEYVRAGREGKFLEALKIIKERIPLPMSIGRICPRFCEKDCRRNVTGEAVAINEFKRLAADLHFEEYMEDLPVLTGRRVAVVGAGPAGLSTAYYLRRSGIESVVYDRLPEPGGMLRYEIPEFRLPKSILKKEVDHLRKMGIRFECGQELGKEIQLDVLRKEFDAVAITIGCWKAMPLQIEGEELAADGIEWLKNVALAGYRGENPGTVIVIGGGSTAMDCCRVPLRLGSPNVHCFYRRGEKEMPAERIEVEEAMEEGVRFSFLTAPVHLKRGANGRLVLTCQKMELGEPDASGRRRPVPVVGSEFDTEADLVIAAIGQRTDATKELKTNRWGNVDVEPGNSRMEGNVFAAGDCATGAATVVEAVTGGRKIAIAIADFLEGRLHSEPPVINVSRGHWRHLEKDDLVYLKKVSHVDRAKPRLIPMEERRNTFRELFPTFTPEDLATEGKRCLECSCTAKGDCKLKEYSESYGANPEAIKGEKIACGYDNRHPVIIHDRMKCIKCGVCIKICSEVVNANLLSYKNRGFSTIVGTAFAETLPDSCRACGACVKECPVGALDWKDKSLLGLE
jgi:formate dehydrogenase major subunit